MIDHVSLAVKDYAKSKAFYTMALAPLGFMMLTEIMDHTVAGFGATRPQFWIGQDKPHSTATHVAFIAKTRDAVNAFYEAGLAAGGKDNGKPGLRPEYHKDYYGAFLLDPDGNNVEAVCHTPG